MDTSDAIAALSALAQPTRLAAFRALVRAYPEPVPAGVLALSCEVPHNTLSTHLAVLSRTALVVTERRGRQMLYRAAIGRLDALVLFLARDCCEGRPELCSILLPSSAGACCAPATAAETPA